jgi:hypothetical protein
MMEYLNVVAIIVAGLMVGSELAIAAFMRTRLISCRLPKADSALLRSPLFHRLCRFVFSSSGMRRRVSPFAEASDPGGSRNGSTEMRS